MPIQLHSPKGSELYHRSSEKSQKHSIFGGNKMMNFAYVPVSNVERNNRGFFTASHTKNPSYSRKEHNTINHTNSIDAPVWTLPVEKPLSPNAATQNNSINNQKKSSSRTFVWPYGGKHVVLTGDFDHWQGSIVMAPVNGLFEAKVDNLDCSVDIEYKFIVDGDWCYDINADSVTDGSGNTNNIIYAQGQ
ncbi:immunoglobulin E-set [Parasitella parasitica]|nr:immunoglobulin E-set [Parasitella parasitica]